MIKKTAIEEHTGTELIEVIQLPVIQERLLTIKTQIEAAVAEALAMECTEDNLQTVKKKRAELRKAFDDLEQRRKQAKEQIMAPYMAFEKVYKECVTDVFAPGDKQLKEAIDNIESGIKQAKADKAKTWFNEYAASSGIDFLTWEQVGLSVTKSVSLKKLNEQSKKCLDRVHEELEMIKLQTHAEEILAEYKANGCNVAGAITTVKQRHEAIERERERWEAERLARERQASAEAEKLAAIEESAMEEQSRQAAPDGLPAPDVTEAPEEELFDNIHDDTENDTTDTENDTTAEDNTVYTLSFKVWGTLNELRALKQFLVDGGYRYE